MSPRRATIRIELHGHSTASDGSLRPEALADQLADSGVVVASLTDHDTVEGLAAFREALARRGVAFLSGLEATVAFGEEEIHLLSWGFDPAHPDVVEAWGRHPPSAEHGNGSLADSLRRLERAPGAAGTPPDGPARAGSSRITAEAAIRLLHRAGGRVFLAHPFTLRSDAASLRPVLLRLKELGLDGLEALYSGYSSGRQAELVALARELGMAVSAGSDVHGPEENERLGVELPVEDWKAFRRLLQAPEPGSSDAASEPAPARRLEWRHFALHILGPTLLALALSVAAVFGILLPSFERSLLDRKRETIRELVASAWSLLAELEAGERAGRYDRQQAQQLARARVAALRYGREGKDYFWLQDMHPRIVMHPYRRDLEGQDVSHFRDPRGARIFVEFAQVVRRRQEGYVEYVWQWKDDPRRMAAKESYVRGFAPWGWVIGTGIYLDDVKAEISRIERNIFWVSIGIAALVALLLGYVMRQSLGLERERSRAEESLRESTRRYRTLVEAATEGNLLVLGGRLRYANPVLLKLLGYSAAELELCTLDEVLPAGEGNEQAWSAVERVGAGGEVAGSVDGALLGRDGRLLECVLSLSAITFAGERGFILNVREVATRSARSRPGSGVAGPSDGDLEAIARNAPVGLFRARFARRGAILETNPAAAEVLESIRDSAEDGPRTLASLLSDDQDLDRFREELLAGGVARRIVHAATSDGRARAIALTAHLARNEAGDPAFVDAVLEDVSARVRQDVERDAMLERLRGSLSFLDEPVRSVIHALPACLPDTTVRAAAELLAGSPTAALLVQSERGEALGLVTDVEIRRGLPETLRDSRTPVRRVMSAPLHPLLDDAPVYEALQAMEEHRVKHLVVEDADRQVVGIVDVATLLQFQSYGALVLAREIARAGGVEEVVRLCRRTAGLVSMLLRCGAAPRHLTRMIASVSDAAGERLVALAVDELGPPPCDFAFVALGSQARHEQTLATDQDNAIVFAPGEGDDEEALRSYFTRLGRLACGWLDQAGYRACKGDVMASNPAWCLSLAAWKETFRRWIRESTPRQLVELSIFFDLRAVTGNPSLVAELRRDIHATVAANPDFLPRLARSSLEFRPPVRLFGRILPGGAGGEHLGRLDLKDASHPISTFARVFALRHGIQESSTIGRLQALLEGEVLSATTGDDVTGAFDHMMRVRIRHQVSQVLADQQPDNVVPLSRLSATELTLLKQGFTAIEAVQSKTRFELLGGTT